jgi:lipoprotein-releasing system permease protein
MRFEFFVALRYLRARRKQAVISVVTLISIIGVVAGVAALIIALSLNSGFQSEFQNRILGATSHVNLFRMGSGPIDDFERLADVTRNAPEVVAVVPSLYAQALLQSDLRQQPAILKGVRLREADRSLLPPIREGDVRTFDAARTPAPVILGKDLAEGLGVIVGEKIRAIGLSGRLSPLGRMPRIQTFEVVAIFESGLWEYDANWALIPLAAGQKFVGYEGGQVSTLEYRIADIYAAPEVATAIRQLAGASYATNTWIELNRPLFAALRLEKLAMFMAIGLIVIVASLNIVSTLTLMVMEKNRDIAIISAMGGTSRTIMAVFMLQGLIIGIVGTIIGAVLGCAGAWYFNRYQVFQLEPQVYSIPYVPFRLEVFDVIAVCTVAVLISFLATLYPARAASRLHPVEAIRYE